MGPKAPGGRHRLPQPPRFSCYLPWIPRVSTLSFRKSPLIWKSASRIILKLSTVAPHWFTGFPCWHWASEACVSQQPRKPQAWGQRSPVATFGEGRGQDQEEGVQVSLCPRTPGESVWGQDSVVCAQRSHRGLQTSGLRMGGGARRGPGRLRLLGAHGTTGQRLPSMQACGAAGGGAARGSGPTPVSRYPSTEPGSVPDSKFPGALCSASCGASGCSPHTSGPWLPSTCTPLCSLPPPVLGSHVAPWGTQQPPDLGGRGSHQSP